MESMLILGEMAMIDGEEAEQSRTEQGKQRALTKGRLPADSPALPLASPALICSHPLASNVTGCALLALLPPCGAACGQLFLPAPSRSPISAAVKCLQCQMTTAMQRFASRSAGHAPAPHLQINKSGRTQFNTLKPFCPLPATAPQHPQTLHFRACTRTPSKRSSKSGRCDRPGVTAACSRWCGAYAPPSTPLQLDRLALEHASTSQRCGGHRPVC